MPGNTEYSYWIAKCKYCGKIDDFQRASKEGPLPPVVDPNAKHLSPICHDSPSRQHKMEWVRYK